MGIKRCPKCKKEKDFTFFYNCKNSKNNISPYCKVCSKERSTSYARKNKDKIPTVGYSLKRRYGITSEEYLTLLIEQKEVCKICKMLCATGRALAVDHDHKSGKIRGLLCSSCNTGLGQFKDNIDLLKEAIKYLNGESK